MQTYTSKSWILSGRLAAICTPEVLNNEWIKILYFLKKIRLSLITGSMLSMRRWEGCRCLPFCSASCCGQSIVDNVTAGMWIVQALRWLIDLIDDAEQSLTVACGPHWNGRSFDQNQMAHLEVQSNLGEGNQLDRICRLVRVWIFRAQSVWVWLVGEVRPVLLVVQVVGGNRSRMAHAMQVWHNRESSAGDYWEGPLDQYSACSGWAMSAICGMEMEYHPTRPRNEWSCL